MKRHHRYTRTAALALALAAFAAPTALAQQDLRSPDARDAARAAMSTQDLRSPDARDAAVRPFAHTVVADRAYVAQAPTAAPASGSFDWTLGALLALVAIGCAGAIVVLRRKTGGHPIAALADGTRDWRRGAGI
jgi:hypothetical protein